MDLVNIAKSWIISFNPTQVQQQLAEYRISVCNTCEYAKYYITFNMYGCEICNYPLNKKYSHLKTGKKNVLNKNG